MSSFKDLLLAKGFSASAESTEVQGAEPEATEPLSFAPKVVVRYTKKGRGGKAVTLVAGVESGLSDLLAKLKRELGVGARSEDGELVIQGSQVERVARWLESQGAARVIRG